MEHFNKFTCTVVIFNCSSEHGDLNKIQKRRQATQNSELTLFSDNAAASRNKQVRSFYFDSNKVIVPEEG